MNHQQFFELAALGWANLVVLVVIGVMVARIFGGTLRKD
jgi:hypothetical protein